MTQNEVTLTEVTISEFTNRIDRDLEKLGYSLDSDLSAFPEDRRSKIAAVLERRDRLTEIASPTSQVQAYDQAYESSGLWAMTFTRLGTINEDRFSMKEGDNLRQHIWTSLRSCGYETSEFMRFQEIFCHPQDYIVPKFQIKPKGIVEFSPESIKYCSSVLGTLVSPDRISLTLAKKLMIYDPEQDKGNAWARLESRSKLSVLEAVKLIWDSSITMSHHIGRIRIISTPNQALLDKYPDGISLPRNEILGKLLISRCLTQEKKSHDGVVWQRRGIQLFQDPHNSMRGAFHIAEQYFGEVAKIRDIQSELKHIHSRVNLEWESSDLEQREILISLSKEAIDKAITYLERKVDSNKVHAKDLLVAAREFRNSRGHINPTPFLVRVVNGINSLDKRVESTHVIGGKIHETKTRSLDQIEAASANIRYYSQRVESAADLLSLNLTLFREDLSSDQRTKQAQSVLFRLALEPNILCEVDTIPYNLIAEKIRKNYDLLKTSLHQGNKEAAFEALVRMQIVVKFHTVYDTFEKIKLDLAKLESELVKSIPSSPESIIKNLHDRAAYLKVLFQERQIVPKHEVEKSFKDPFNDLRVILNTMERRLQEYLERKPSLEEVCEMLNRFKDFLDKSKIVARIRALP
ncbi:MAG: hypothetical protein SGJ02_13445 [bacterium]|nr:hypothetical protein [bacterium]